MNNKLSVLLLSVLWMSIKHVVIADPYSLNYQDLVSKLNITYLPIEQFTPVEEVTNEEIIKSIEPMLASRSIAQLTKYIDEQPLSFKQKIELLHILIGNEMYGLTYDDAAQLILGIADDYAAYSPEQNEVLNMFFEFPHLMEKTYPLFIAVEHNYVHVINPLIAWAHNMAETDSAIKQELAGLKYRSFKYAVATGNSQVLRALSDVSGGINKQNATDLLWYIVTSGNGISTISELKQLGADVDAVQDGKTPLIAAVMEGKKDMVKAFIQAGANIHKIADLALGSALQQALEKREVDIEQILRDAGAHE